VFGSEAGQVAHLIPAAGGNADTWWFVTRWLFGWGENVPWDTRERAIHGSKTTHATDRISQTGIKHMVSNKIRLMGQQEYMDVAPCVLIVPILRLNQVREWSGEEYEAIVMIDSWKDITISQVAGGIGFGEPGGATAGEGEIETARDLLTTVLRDMGYARMHMPVDVPDDKLPSREYWAGRQRHVTVPEQIQRRNHRVRKVRFAGPEGDANMHPAPDPLFLAAKAAVVWSARFNQRIAAGVEPEDNWSERDYRAAEDYLEMREEMLRPQSWDELARGLGQPYGFQALTKG
jgi:hypothetical protein